MTLLRKAQASIALARRHIEKTQQIARKGQRQFLILYDLSQMKKLTSSLREDEYGVNGTRGQTGVAGGRFVLPRQTAFS